MTLGNRTCKRQSSYNFNINFKHNDGTPIDITGWTVWFTVRKKIAKTRVDSDENAVISKKYINGGTSGIVPITLTPEDTNIDPSEYLYDIQIKKDNGYVGKTDKWKFTIIGDITRDIT